MKTAVTIKTDQNKQKQTKQPQERSERVDHHEEKTQSPAVGIVRRCDAAHGNSGAAGFRRGTSRADLGLTVWRT